MKNPAHNLLRAISQAAIGALLGACVAFANAQDDAHAHAHAMSAQSIYTGTAAPVVDDAAMRHAMHEDMNDDPLLALLRIDDFERTLGGRDATMAWKAQAWIGHDVDKLWLRSEGERAHGATDARIEAFWNRAFATFWDWQLGARHDFGNDLPARDWLAFGVHGIAPYWFEIEATAYLGERGRRAVRLRVSYEMLLTQRLILEPEVEFDAYSSADRAHGRAAGLADITTGLRLHYEIRREFAPYVGLVWQHRRGEIDSATASSGTSSNSSTNTAADIARGSRRDTRLVAGLRLWF